VIRLTGLARQLRGELLLPNDHGYDTARLPPLSMVPPGVHGRLAVLITLVWCGELDAGERVVNTLRTVAPPIADLVDPRPYPVMYELIPEAPRSVTNITYSFAADELDEVAIASILQRLEESSLPSTEALAAVELPGARRCDQPASDRRHRLRPPPAQAALLRGGGRVR
jgi:hypothetical protein